jgi:hypothetical protein
MLKSPTKCATEPYFLFTNARLTGTAESTIRNAFLNNTGIKQFAAFGVERISMIIRESSRLRMLVPRVYGLGDLSQILDERAHSQAREILSSLGDDLAKFVITEAYQRSAKALVDHGFVLLLGEPACGKSTIAAALAVGALDEWGCSTFKVRNADDFKTHSNPHESKQFFWVDDAFGATQFDWSSAAAWNSVFPHMNAAIRRGARVLFTSRDYIYYSARKHLKESAFPVIAESQVVIHVERLRQEEKEQILYNHVRLGGQPRQFKQQLKNFLPDVAAHLGFSPEIARRLGNPLFTRRLTISESGLNDFVSHPLELLSDIIRTIDPGCRSALALVFMRGGTLPSPVNMNAEEESAVSLIGGNSFEVRNALNALNGSLIIQTMQGGSYSWRFKHPTVRDAFATVIAEDRELLDIYLAGAPIDRLFNEVTCGDVGVQGVKVIVPSSRYELLLSRLETFNIAQQDNLRKLHRFLAYRCDRDFLVRLITKIPNFISNLQVGSYLNAISDVDVIVRLQQFGLLPETKRCVVATEIHKLALVTPDAGFLQEGIRTLLMPEEFAKILEDVRTKLLPELPRTVQNWRDDFYHNQQDPESYFDELVNALKEFRDELSGHYTATIQIESALAEIKEIILDLMAEQPQEPDSDDFRGSRTNAESDDGSRSVFDDVDQ